jgi:exodeoxyribonuclease V gamma subunit
MCSLEPMRAVPHRVVCLLGLDDGAFPRGGGTDGDDVLLRDPCLGERDRRSEDRQLFLDAVLAAREHLVVVYTGADERTGAVRPPAVPVSELLDALDRAATASDGRSVRDQVVVRHPLQAVDERNFAVGALGRPGPFSFGDLAHRAARAGREPRVQAPPFLSEALPDPEPVRTRTLVRSGPAHRDAAAVPQPDEVVDLDDLVTMLEHPVKWFLRQRLQVSLPGETDDVEDRLPLKVQGLDEWAIGQRLLGACLAGVDERRARAVEWRRGEVPPKALGAATLDAIVEKVVPIAAAAERYTVGPATGVDVTAALGSCVLTGTVPGVHGSVVVRTTYSRLAPKHRLRAWVQLLALSADRGGAGDWRAVTVGRAQGSRPRAAVARLRAPAAAFAAERLAELVELRRRALREPLPMPVAAACAYAQSRQGGDLEVQALDSARRVWASAYEAEDRHHALCWGEDVALDVLLGPPEKDESVWWPEEGTRLGVLARRVWAPLLDHEETETL